MAALFNPFCPHRRTWPPCLTHSTPCAGLLNYQPIILFLTKPAPVKGSFLTLPETLLHFFVFVFFLNNPKVVHLFSQSFHRLCQQCQLKWLGATDAEINKNSYQHDNTNCPSLVPKWSKDGESSFSLRFSSNCLRLLSLHTTHQPRQNANLFKLMKYYYCTILPNCYFDTACYFDT